MVKHGHNKKRRAGRIGKTKLKHNTYTKWNPKPKFSNATVEKLWDTTKSPRQNAALMGLAVELNAVDHRSGDDTPPPDETTTKPSMVELFDIPDSDAMGPNTSKRLPLNAQEQAYMVKCMAKYGTNYTAMFRDTKMNPLQHTRERLQKMGSRFVLLHPDQIQILAEDIPESVQALMETKPTAS